MLPAFVYRGAIKGFSATRSAVVVVHGMKKNIELNNWFWFLDAEYVIAFKRKSHAGYSYALRRNRKS